MSFALHENRKSPAYQELHSCSTERQMVGSWRHKAIPQYAANNVNIAKLKHPVYPPPARRPMPFPEKTAATDSRVAVTPPAARATVAIAFVQGMLAGLQHAGRDPALLLERATSQRRYSTTRRRAFPSRVMPNSTT
jgi:hypothetical protein